MNRVTRDKIKSYQNIISLNDYIILYMCTTKIIRNVLTHIETFLKADMHVMQIKYGTHNNLNVNNKNYKRNRECTACGNYVPSNIQI